MFIDDALFQDMWRGSLHHSSSQTLDYMAKELTYTGNFLLSLFKLKWFMYSAGTITCHINFRRTISNLVLCLHALLCLKRKFQTKTKTKSQFVFTAWIMDVSIAKLN